MAYHHHHHQLKKPRHPDRPSTSTSTSSLSLSSTSSSGGAPSIIVVPTPPKPRKKVPCIDLVSDDDEEEEGSGSGSGGSRTIQLREEPSALIQKIMVNTQKLRDLTGPSTSVSTSSLPLASANNFINNTTQINIKHMKQQLSLSLGTAGGGGSNNREERPVLLVPPVVLATSSPGRDPLALDSDNENVEVEVGNDTTRQRNDSGPAPPKLLRADVDVPTPEERYSDTDMPDIDDPLPPFSLSQLLREAAEHQEVWQQQQQQHADPPQRNPRVRKTESQIRILTRIFNEHNGDANANVVYDAMFETRLPARHIKEWFGKRKRDLARGIIPPVQDFPAEPPPASTTTSRGPEPYRTFGTNASPPNHPPSTPNPRPSTSTASPRSASVSPNTTKKKKEPPTEAQMENRIRERKAKIEPFETAHILRKGCKGAEKRTFEFVRLYMKLEDCMKKKIQIETRRLAECSRSEAPFSNDQGMAINTWVDTVVGKQKMKPIYHRKQDTLDLVKSLLKTWAPLFVYGALLDVQLEDTLADFTFASRHRAFSLDTKEYMTLKLLHYKKRSQTNK